MPRRARGDGVGVIHHVVNRGIAKRTCFESRTDIRRFLAELARSARRGEIEVLAYCILTTHFHLVLRSPTAMLSDGMRRIENAYVRYFNRRRRRDGPLFRGRFWSKPVRSDTYLRVLVRYVDHNSVGAGLADRPSAYPWGSARHYAHGSGPPWLSRAVVEGLIEAASVDERFTPKRYVQMFGGPPTEAQEGLVAQRSVHSGCDEDSLDDLIMAAPAVVREWMVRKAQVADGTRPGLPLTAGAVVMDVVAAATVHDPRWRVRPRRVSVSGWAVVATGLLRLHAACTFDEIVARLGGSVRTARDRVIVHRELLRSDEEYGARAAELLRRSMLASVGGAWVSSSYGPSGADGGRTPRI